MSKKKYLEWLNLQIDTLLHKDEIKKAQRLMKLHYLATHQYEVKH